MDGQVHFLYFWKAFGEMAGLPAGTSRRHGRSNRLVYWYWCTGIGTGTGTGTGTSTSTGTGT
eukprot:13897935-Heterocapsa_arctica.AAC.1